MISPRRSRGRPKPAEAPRISERLLDIAAHAFVAHGYSATTMERIVAMAGVSKSTLYSRFPDKRALFAAVVQHLSRRRTPAALSDDDGLAIDAGLLLRAREIVAITLEPELLMLHQLGRRENWRFPEVGQILSEGARGLYMDRLESYLRRHAATGTLRGVDIPFHAGMLQMMILDLIDGALARKDQLLGTSRFDADLEKIVRTFLHGICAPAGDGRR